MVIFVFAPFLNWSYWYLVLLVFGLIGICSYWYLVLLGGFSKEKHKFHGVGSPPGEIFEKKTTCKTKNVTFWKWLVIQFWYRIQNLRKKTVILVSRTSSKELSASSSDSSKLKKNFGPNVIYCFSGLILLVLLVFGLIGVRSYWYSILLVFGRIGIFSFLY